MHGRLGKVAGVAGLLMCCAVPGAAHSLGAVCGPAAARTLAEDSTARVYSRQGTVYGCARAGSRSYRLGATSNSSHEGRAGPIALSGVQAAYGLTFFGVDTVTAEIVVRRLTDGHVERRHGAINGPVGAEDFQTVDDVAVKTDASVAWIAHFSQIGARNQTVTQVNKSDRTDRSLLDDSSSIDTHSLSLHRSQLSWKDGSTRRSATLR